MAYVVIMSIGYIHDQSSLVSNTGYVFYICNLYFSDSFYTTVPCRKNMTLDRVLMVSLMKPLNIETQFSHFTH